MAVEDKYEKWLEEPKPENMAEVLRELEPVIVGEAAKYEGPKPLLRSKGKSLAAQAVKKYDPSKGAGLRTWVTTNLKPLSRYGRQMRTVYTPERAVQQSAGVHSAQEQFKDEHGRDPSDDELADEVGLSKKRIKDIRNKTAPALYESGLPTAESGRTELPSVYSASDVDYASEAVYSNLNDRQKKIYDWKIGGHGKPVLSNQEIAKRLGLSPAAVSNASKMITRRVRKVMDVV